MPTSDSVSALSSGASILAWNELGIAREGD